MTRSHGMFGEAEAVVAEALALERETEVETAELLGRRADGPLGDRAQVGELWKAVNLVSELCIRMQNPLRHSRYAPLGESIGRQAAAMRIEIRDFVPEEVVVADDD